MIANAINIVLGLVLVYVAVLQPALLQGQLQEVIELLVGAAIVGLGFWERRSDYHPWHGHVIAVLGAAVILLELVGFGLEQIVLVTSLGSRRVETSRRHPPASRRPTHA